MPTKNSKKSTKRKALKQTSFFSSHRYKLLVVAIVMGVVGLVAMFDSFATSDKSKDDPTDFVVAISVDGLRPDAITKLGKTKTPNIHKFMKSGVYTLNARNDYNVTVTLPNHTSMLTGRPVLSKNGHHVTINKDNGGTVHKFAKKKINSIFDVVHNRGGTTEMVATKDKFNFINRTWDNKNGSVDRVGKNNGRDKIDRYYLNEKNSKDIDSFASRIKKKPSTFSFVHIRYPDSAGHKYGWMSPQYMSAVRESDKQVGKIMNAIASSKKYSNRVATILTSDHGGTGKSHSDPKIATNYKVPFMVMARNAPKNVNLYSLNKKSRKSPGNARVSYKGMQPIRNSDVANLTADLLDLPSVPGSIVDFKQNLNIFR